MTPQDNSVNDSLWSAITEVIKGLKNQPALLLGMGFAIILLAAGALAIENLRLIVIALLALATVALIVWVLNEALKAQNRSRKTQESTPGIKAGDAVVEKGAIANRAKLTGGSVTIRLDGIDGDMKAGNAHVSPNARVEDARLEGGNIDIDAGK
jgi:membrane protein implicated in regulation of membrane protease activity